MSFEDQLRWKWKELPTQSKHVYSDKLLLLSDKELKEFYTKLISDFENARGNPSVAIRSWIYRRYDNRLKGKHVLDIGCGLGGDGLHFALKGVNMTFSDIVESNVKLVQRTCKLLGVKADFYFIKDLFKFSFKGMFDYLYFMGSIHHTPFEIMQKEVKAIAPFLKKGGYALVLSYPKERYIKSGAKDFKEFGRHTDGERTPWAEWYDEAKIMKLFGENFKLVFSEDYGWKFNWFEIQKVK